jgi:hypothetical protein
MQAYVFTSDVEGIWSKRIVWLDKIKTLRGEYWDLINKNIYMFYFLDMTGRKFEEKDLVI